MADFADDIACLEAMVEDVRRIAREPVSRRQTPTLRYLEVSNVVTHLKKAIESMRHEL